MFAGDKIPDEKKWFYFIFVSLGSYFSLLLLALIYILIKSKCVHAQQVCYHLLCLKVDGNTGLRSTNQKLNPLKEVSFKSHMLLLYLALGSFVHEIQEWAESLNSGQTLTGRVLVVSVFLCNILAMV